jgi:hypothetical protein
MARKVSAGSAGGAGVAGLQAFTTTLTSATNLDIIIDPTGTGRFLINGDAQLLAQGDLRFADADSSNWVAFQSPAVVASNVTWTLPAIDRSNNQVLTTNGSGTLSWTAKSLGIEDNTTDSNVNYPLLSSLTTGNLLTGRVTSSRMDFQPSTGRFRLLGGTGSTNTTTGTLIVTGGVGISERLYAGSIQNTPIGNITRNSGAFTTLTANSTSTLRDTIPESNNSFDLGTNAVRWRNIFTNDLNLSNGIGDYTIVEGEHDLFLYNNKNKKVYKFLVEEVDPSVAPKKQE